MSESPTLTPADSSINIAESPIHIPDDSPVQYPKHTNKPQIDIETVSEEEMALIESAMAAARSLIISPPVRPFQANVRSIESIAVHSKRRLSGCCSSSVGEIEDVGKTQQQQQKKKVRMVDSLLHRFRKRGLSVTDITSSEWCQKQMEFVLLQGKPKPTEAMKAGTDRHAKLEAEVIQKVEVRIKEIEDVWALKLMNFIVGANQLLSEGLTRELPVFCFVQGVWMIGVIDEIYLPSESALCPRLVENKTRSQAALPREAQKRNAKLQLMCYKYIWDSIANNSFPGNRFYNSFGLNPQYVLSEEVRKHASRSGFVAKTLEDLVMCYRDACYALPPSHDDLLLRYEYQADHSLIGEEKFTYDAAWVDSQLKCSLEFWLGETQPSYVSQEEKWKCNFCNFASSCPNFMESTRTRSEKYTSNLTK